MKRGEPQSAGPAPAKKPAPAYFSNAVFAMSLVLGLALGLSLTRMLGPRQHGGIEPWQLGADDRNHYMMAIALEYAARRDLPTALNKLIALRPATDPLEALAEGSCDLGGRGYLSNGSGIKALRSAVDLYRSQGRAGCAERLLPPLDTASAPTVAAPDEADIVLSTPQPTKPPLHDETAGASDRRVIPTQPAARRFEGRPVRSFCDLTRPAVIEVYVVDYLGRGIPGQRIRARWGEQESVFVSGLKVDRGDAYADFQMEAGSAYTLDMPGAAEPLAASLRTGECYSGNRQSLKSYRVTFVAN